MALLTKLQARGLVQQMIDDPSAVLWSAANLDRVIELALDELWGEILEVQPWLRSTEESVTPTAPGVISLGWTDGTGQLAQRFFRLQNLVRDGQDYWPAHPKDVLVSDGVVVSAPHRTYALLGEQLHLFPYATTAVRVRYSSRPAAFTTLGDGDAVEFPDGHALAYVYAAASLALDKGDREDSTRMEKRAEKALWRLKSWLTTPQVGPIMPWSNQSGIEWGSVE